MFTASKKSLAVATVFAAALAASAGAAHAEGLYVGGALGTPHYQDSINGVSGSGSGLGGKIYGGYGLSPNFAIEGGLFDLGHIDDGTGRVDLRGAYVDALGRYELAPKWSVLGSVGLADGRFSTPAGNDWSPALKLGAGLQYELSKQVALRAEYEQYRFTNAFDAKPKVGEFTVGVNVGF
jgi:OOP family OmpA-OmpF porin